MSEIWNYSSADPASMKRVWIWWDGEYAESVAGFIPQNETMRSSSIIVWAPRHLTRASPYSSSSPNEWDLAKWNGLWKQFVLGAQGCHIRGPAVINRLCFSELDKLGRYFRMGYGGEHIVPAAFLPYIHSILFIEQSTVFIAAHPGVHYQVTRYDLVSWGFMGN